ncbi:acetyl/propionyl/methylcrotonyl-CoA carboxylase subunit alpha [Planosporangium mesophilum]|uniref:Putative acetyl-/propionyl-CoA carboxylase alpha subunit AccA2 n=1 Tax=Planosporangium mesophilum TaxID=689768 RepID=A0A8J3TG81_9ACTN|nr:biotin carboxylase N-terminal domain-containing protein [Planosporangium mesophilum]NJC83785.1 biotin/lipoyl-binding protein [Planosporangium mesophilum]GII25217.1 putative acetyl-/propionyl-CoA carboxylase alpha subunit AccA2 [Planosporangium mesophilum]
MIKRLLVANRGEIARRIFATCRAIGVETVAVYSNADADSPHVAEADFAVNLPGNAASATYLRGDLIVAAALRAGADAVHPGYGFLSENADFAQAVVDARLTWVGPPPKAIALMGSKLEAKALLAEAGVNMLPSHTDPDEVDVFPVLVKASAGGGGRGMRVVRDRESLAEAVASARREAASAFGDGTVFCERYVEGARHIEVQVLADGFGNVVTLGERECSIQRRHQKIVEETPSPAVTPTLREELCAAAVIAAQAVGYVGAGTVEFLLSPSGEFYFLEMNTRLQVEHPVTECVVGVDLVRLQLLVAEGDALPFDGPPPLRGHAIEARLYAEDPASAWAPSTGTLHRFAIPGVSHAFGPLPVPGLRLDSGVGDGSVVGVHYDPMLAKLIAWGPSRAEAARLLSTALAHARIHGLKTNRDLLVRVLRHPSFLAGTIDTGFLDTHPEVFAPLLAGVDATRLSCLAAALAGSAQRSAASSLPSGWRNVPSAPQRVAFEGPTGCLEVSYRLDRSGALAEWSVRPVDRDEAGLPGAAGGASPHDHPPAAIVSAAPDRVVLDVSGIRLSYAIHRVDGVSYVDSSEGSVTLTELPRFPARSAEASAGSLVAPLPGAVTRVLVVPGQRVSAGDLLLTLEAMKLEHAVHAPAGGIVADLRVGPGSQVETGTLLAVLNPD